MSLRAAIASTSRVLLPLSSRTLPACTCAHLRRLTSKSLDPPKSSLRSFTSSISRPAGGKRTVQPAGFSRDDAIRARWIKLVLDDEEGGGLGEVQPKKAALERLDRRDFYLQQVDQQDMTPEESRITRDRGQIAICKLVSKKEAASLLRERKAAQKERRKAAAEEKELQLTWGVSLNDLGHKLKKGAQVLDKGGRLALVISAPKGSNLPSRPERQAFVDSLKQHLGLGTDKVKVWKEDEWRGSKTSTFLTGTPMKAAAAAGAQTQQQVATEVSSS